MRFQADLDKVFYVMLNDVSSLNHNGAGQGYISASFCCDSSFAYSHSIRTAIYDTTDPLTPEIIEINNYGSVDIMPHCFITKIGDGDISIENLSNYREPFKINNLVDGEKVQVEGMYETIETDLEAKHRYDDSNEEYLKLGIGNNRLKVMGDCIIQFEYEYKHR